MLVGGFIWTTCEISQFNGRNGNAAIERQRQQPQKPKANAQAATSGCSILKKSSVLVGGFIWTTCEISQFSLLIFSVLSY